MTAYVGNVNKMNSKKKEGGERAELEGTRCVIAAK
jgi:hypothetical protein